MSGLIGIYSDENISLDLYYAMYAIQHRGQGSMGVVTLDEEQIYSYHGKGTISENLTANEMQKYRGTIGIGHVYNDVHIKNKPDHQPHILEDGSVIAIEGKIVNEDFTIEKMASTLQGSKKEIANYVSNLRGAFTIIYVKDKTMYVIRDCRGIKPVSIGIRESTYVVSSETCAFDAVGARHYKDLIPGEILKIDKNGLISLYAKSDSHNLCLFEMIYTQRPDSEVEGVSVYSGRYNCGKILYRENPTKADIVIGAPDSGIIAAQGYAVEGKIPYRTGLIKNRYVGRTFINPTEETRNIDIRLKLNAIKNVLAGKDVILVDDSIVRGSTMRRTIKILKDAGAKKVHVRVASPPIIKNDNFSINIPDDDKLIAYNKTAEQIKEELDCDSLYYLSIEGLRESFGNKGYYERYFGGE